jgi:dTDP-4-amino-4,6-dideoxygalactose transaminase
MGRMDMIVRNAGPTLFAQDEILRDLKEVLQTCWLTTGAWNERLEKGFAQLNDVRYGITCGSGGQALALVLALLQKDGRTTCYVPVNTHVASVSSAILMGYDVRICDVTAEMMLNIDDPLFQPDERSVVVLVSIGGFLPSNTKEIARKVADAGGILVLDAAHAHGTEFDGRPVGSYGLAATYSFYPTKLVVAGEGGIVLTDSREFNSRLLRARDLGKASNTLDLFVEPGFSSRMSNVLACIGWHQLIHLDEIIARRTAIVKRYIEVVEGKCGYHCPDGNTKPNWYKFTLLFEDAAHAREFDTYLLTHGIESSSKIFPFPLSAQPEVARRSTVTLGTIGRRVAESHVCLPLYIGIDDSAVDYVCEVVGKFFV